MPAKPRTMSPLVARLTVPARALARRAARDPEPGSRDRSVRPRLWPEVLILGVCYAIYSMIRNLVPTDVSAATARAYDILNMEYALGLDIEYRLNRLFVANEPLAVSANYFYATMHFAMTIGVLVWLYTRRPARYAIYRSLLFVTTLVGLAGFWLYPLAPPRFLPGYVDTVIAFGTWGIYDSGPTASVSNQYAAMPSMHTAWSLWCAIAIIGVARRRWVRCLAALYPTATILVIIGTGNHFVLDAVGGAVAIAIAYGLLALLARLSTLLIPAWRPS